MAMMKVLELMASSNKSWEDAVQNAVAHASKTLHGIKSVWIQDQSATVKNNKVEEFRVNVKLTFELDKSELKKGK